jgi:hypothetical protein
VLSAVIASSERGAVIEFPPNPMSDRKYRQRGYQESDRKPAEKPKGPGGPTPRGDRPEGPRTPNLMPTRQVVRCAKCGSEIASPDEHESRCSKCGADVHTCAQCTYFDPGARFQCMHPVPERIAPKDAKNSCPLWEPRKTVERETHSAPMSSARSAFDDLFK